jgi:tetratricopeptide (TPR) repeat protein
MWAGVAVMAQAYAPTVPAAESEALFLADWSMAGADLDVGSPESVAWTLRYPLLFSAGSMAGMPWAEAARAYEEGRLLEALIGLDGVAGAARTAGYHTYRAHLLLLAGSEQEARRSLDEAGRLSPDSAEVAALRAILSLREGRREEALAQAERAVAAAPGLAAAHLARSYARQAGRDLTAARASAEEVLRLDPAGVQARLRMAELDMAVGRPADALSGAGQAVRLAPGLGRAHDTLGFALLANDRAQDALASFAEAARINTGDAVAHFGLGLAHIRVGQRTEGQERLETAVELAPGNALLHTYLGRVYDLAGRSRDAAVQYALAAQADPRDPTPRRFEAMRLAADNRPAAARTAMQAALERVDQRAVYRMPQLLAQDRSLHLADLAALEGVLGLGERAWETAALALATDPGLGAVHLAAGDALAAQPRAGLAREGEYLQALLRGPLGALPPPLLLTEGVQPGAVAPQQGFFRAATPEGVGFNEYGAVFTAAGPHLDLDATAGNRATLGEQVRLAGAAGRLGLSLSQLHFESDGFDAREALDHAVWRGVVRYDPLPGSRLHLEYQHAEGARDGTLFPDDSLFNLPQRIDERRNRTRVALRHRFDAAGELLVLAGREDLEQDIDNLPTAGNLLLVPRRDRQDVRSDGIEAQYLWRSDGLRLTAGAGHHRDEQRYRFGPGEHVFGTLPANVVEITARTRSAYVYGQRQLGPDLLLEAGLAADDQDYGGFTQRFLSPKLGLRWQAVPGGVFSFAASRGLNRFFLGGAGLEPTQVAGFQQVYNDGPGVRADRLGLGWTQRLAGGWEWGAQVSGRELRLPLLGFIEPFENWREREARFWLSRVLPRETLANLLPGWEGALTLAYDGQDYTRHGLFFGVEQIRDYRPQHLRLGGRLFHAGGWGLDLGLTWVDAQGERQHFTGERVAFGDDFPVADAALTWRLPGRRGQLSLGAINLFDNDFRYLEMDPAHPRFAPGRFVYARLRLGL